MAGPTGPEEVALVIEKNGQNVLSWVFEPGLSCESKSDPWQSETVEVILGGSMQDVACECRGDGLRLYGTCPPSL